MKNKTIVENIYNESLQKILQEALDVLEANDGKSLEEKKDQVVSLFRDNTTCFSDTDTETEISTVIEGVDDEWIKEVFWSAGDFSCPDGSIVLRPVTEEDREDYFEIQRSYSLVKTMLNDEEFCNELWDEYVCNTKLMCTIAYNGIYVGYCGVDNVAKRPWELSIELKPEWTKQGIGPAALGAMMEQIKLRLGVTEYTVKIDPTNLSSQKMFERLGAVPKGLAEFWIHDPKALEQCEEDNLHCIDDSIIAVAEKFSVEPRKLLSHVLEYSLIW